MEEPIDLSIVLRLLLCSISSVPAIYYLLASLLLLSLFLYRFLEFHLLRDILRGSRGDKVHLTFNPASEIYHCVAAKCRILHGRYLATPWLASPHLQTTFVNFFGNPPSFRYTREIFYTIDGGTIALDWLLPSDVLECTSDRKGGISKDDTTPIVVVVPGLTSDSVASYMKHLVFKLAKSGWNVVVGNHRGLGGISMTSDCFYNAGWTEDVRAIIKHLHQEFPVAPIYAVGTSIGANILVKYLGEDGETTPVAGAASVCSPWDLVIGDRFISRKLVQRLYDRAIAFGLKGFAEMHQPLLSRMANWEGIKRSRSIRDFDNHATCLVANYETVDTYYRRCSSVSFVGNVSVPLLCISALDDPLCTVEAIPWDECRANKNIVLATTTHGGHLAFFQGFSAKMLWWVEAVEEFLRVLHGSPYMHKPKKASDTGPHTVLESNIDKAPYLNVLDDGMLAAVGNEEVANNAECTTDNQVSSDEKGIHVDPAVDVQETGSSKEAPYLASKSLTESTPADIPMKKIAEMVAPVKNSFNRLLRLNSGSVWLLAYIAIVTTWPLVGPALLIALRRKLKRIIPPGWLRK